MPGRRWTDEEQAAYRSTLSLDRLRDELWIAFSVLLFIAVPFFETSGRGNLFLVIWLPTGAFFYLAGRGILRRILPAHVLAHLPVGRFDGPDTPGALHGYRDLLRLWRDPSYLVPLRRDEFRPAPLGSKLALLAAPLAIALAGFALSLVLPGRGTPALDVFTISSTVVIPKYLWNRLRDRGFTSPAACELAAVVAVVVLAELAAFALRWAVGKGRGEFAFELRATRMCSDQCRFAPSC